MKLLILLLFPIFLFGQGQHINYDCKLLKHDGTYYEYKHYDSQYYWLYPTFYMYDKDYSFTTSTDQFQQVTSFCTEMWGFRYNIALSAYDNMATTESTVDRYSCSLTKRVDFGIYFPTMQWRDMTVGSGSIILRCPVIPDFMSATWTASGVSAFSGATLGEAKATFYPQCGQDLYNISGGVYGYDFPTSTMGSNNMVELDSMIQIYNQQYTTLYAKKPTAISYQNGSVGVAPALLVLNEYLMGRNSGAVYSGVAITTLGWNIQLKQWMGYPNEDINIKYNINRSGTLRTWDMWHTGGYTLSQACAYTRSIINTNKTSGGWVNDFIHWHSTAGTTEMENYLDSVADMIDTNCWNTSVNKVAEYWYHYKSINSVTYSLVGDTATITIGYNNSYCDTSLLQTPISIFLDITQLGWTGGIGSDALSVHKLSDTTYTIQADFDDKIFKVYKTNSPNYISFAKPVINYTYVVGLLTVTTDIPTRIALYYKTVAGQEYDAVILNRSTVLGTTHTFDFTDSAVRNYWQVLSQADIENNRIYIGAISDYEQSTLSPVIDLTP